MWVVLGASRPPQWPAGDAFLSELRENTRRENNCDEQVTRLLVTKPAERRRTLGSLIFQLVRDSRPPVGRRCAADRRNAIVKHAPAPLRAPKIAGPRRRGPLRSRNCPPGDLFARFASFTQRKIRHYQIARLPRCRPLTKSRGNLSDFGAPKLGVEFRFFPKQFASCRLRKLLSRRCSSFE